VCGKNAKYKDSNNNISYCNTHYKSEFAKKTKKYSLQDIKKINTTQYDTSELQLRLVNKLNSLIPKFSRLNVDEVVIENQPAFKNPRMKAIASTLYDFFLIKGFVDQSEGLSISTVRYMSPCNKLKVNENNTIEVLKRTNKKQKYKMTKELSIKYTLQLLEDNQPYMIDYLWALYKKRDDMCDAYLQGRYYLQIYRKKNKAALQKKKEKIQKIKRKNVNRKKSDKISSDVSDKESISVVNKKSKKSGINKKVIKM
jgi:hypothetical protein